MLTITPLRHAVSTTAFRSRHIAGGALAARLTVEQRRNYHENIVEHYENPRNVGSLDKNDDSVGTGSVCKGGE